MSQWMMPASCSVGDRVGDLRADGGDRVHHDRAALDELAEVLAVEQLHHEVRRAVLHALGGVNFE